jgi:hypothetical protein
VGVFCVVVPTPPPPPESGVKSGIEAPELLSFNGVLRRTVDCRNRERTNPVFYGDTSCLEIF